MDLYKIGVSLAMTSNAPQVLSALSQQLLHVHAGVNQLQGGLNRLKVAIGGAFAVAGGTAMLSTMGKVVDRGNDLVKLQQDMAQAGVKNAEVQEAYAKAWEMTGKYQNVSAVEVMKLINDGRMTFGSQHDATHHIEDFVDMTSFLKSYQDGKHAHGGEGLLAEVNAAMKSGEIAGKVSPDDMKEHVKQLTAMKVAYGEQLKIGQYLTAQRNAGVALRNTTDEFRYGLFPALVQENGQSAGTMLMTAYNKVVAGTGNRTKSLEHMKEIGLLNPSMLEYNKIGMVKGLKSPDGIKGSHSAALNFADWVMTTLKPRLDKQTRDKKTGEIDHIKEAQLISGMFPDRNAAKAITEIIQQFSKFTKDAHLMREARDAMAMRLYTEKSWIAQKQAFTTQWDNFVAALGAPMVPQATEALRSINQAMAGIAGWASAKENAGVLRAVGIGVAGLGASLVGAGAVALIAALGPAGWLVLGIGGLVTGLVAARQLLAGSEAVLTKDPHIRSVRNDAIPGDERFRSASWMDDAMGKLPAIGAGIAAFFRQVGHGAEVIYRAGEATRRWVDGVTEGANGFGEKIAAIFRAVPVPEGLSDLGTRIAETFRSIPEQAQGLVTAISEIGSQMSAAIQGLPGKVSEAISSAIGSIGGMLSSAISGLSGMVSNAISSITSAIGGIHTDSSGKHLPQTEPPRARGNGGAPALDPHIKRGASLVPPPRSQAPVHVATAVQLDGRTVARAVTRHQVAALDTRTGTGRFDDNGLQAPVGYTGSLSA